MNEKEYNDLVKNFETSDYYRNIDLENRVNCYHCQKCGHITKTKDIDRGVIPFMRKCEKCNNLTYSSFYEDIAPLQQIAEEWYRPKYDEYKKMSISTQNHILNGGLVSRKVTK